MVQAPAAVQLFLGLTPAEPTLFRQHVHTWAACVWQSKSPNALRISSLELQLLFQSLASNHIFCGTVRVKCNDYFAEWESSLCQTLQVCTAQIKAVASACTTSFMNKKFCN